MGSGSTAYRTALGEYTALQEHLVTKGQIELEQARSVMEFEKERFSLQRSGKLPAAGQVQETVKTLTVTAPAKTENGADYKKFILPAIIAFLFLRKK